jgi:hypothetical protein
MRIESLDDKHPLYGLAAEQLFPKYSGRQIVEAPPEAQG